MLGLLRRLTMRRDAVGLVVVSFPKSGRTWHRVMLGHYLTQVTGLSTQHVMDLKVLCRAARIGKVIYTHNGANFTAKEADPDKWKGNPVLLIVRDPRDLLVSAYYHAKFRDRIYDGDISTFIRSPETGIQKVLTALNRWNAWSRLTLRFDVVSYEAMHRQPEIVLSTTLACLGIASKPAWVKAAVEFASFDNMKEMERTNALGDKKLALTGAGEQGAKVRSGKIGGYADQLSPEDLAYIDDQTRRMGDPFADAYGATASGSNNNEKPNPHDTHSHQAYQQLGRASG